MSQPPERTSESAADSAAKTTNTSDIRRVVSKTEVVNISPLLLYYTNKNRPALIRITKIMDRLTDSAKEMSLEFSNTDNPTPYTIPHLHDLLCAIQSTSDDFDDLLCMDKDKWIKLAELLDIE